jgi:hypothetical protein
VKFFGRRKFENDMDVELRFHIEAYTEDLIRSGLDRSEAERRARIEFGAKEAIKDECRRSRGFQFMDELRADLLYALRGVRKNPFVTTIAILSLGLGIGANAAIFSLFDQILLRNLPVPEPERLVNFSSPGPRDGNTSCFFMAVATTCSATRCSATSRKCKPRLRESLRSVFTTQIYLLKTRRRAVSRSGYPAAISLCLAFNRRWGD